MYVRISKPRGGLVDVAIDDRRGGTGFYKRVRGRSIEDALAFVERSVKEWEAIRGVVLEAISQHKAKA